MKKKQITYNKSANKPSTFDDYIARRSAHNARLVSQAVSALDGSRFGNLTDYCKSISAVVSEIRTAKSLEPSSPFYKKIVKPLSYVTLLRNATYREIIEDRFNETREVAVEEQEDVEGLRLQIASLLGQTNLLKEKIHAIDAGKTSGTVDDNEHKALLEKANFRIGVLLAVYKNMREGARGVFKSVTEVSEKNPVPGLYAYTGLVMSQQEIDAVSDIARDHPMKP